MSDPVTAKELLELVRRCPGRQTRFYTEQLVEAGRSNGDVTLVSARLGYLRSQGLVTSQLVEETGLTRNTWHPVEAASETTASTGIASTRSSA